MADEPSFEELLDASRHGWLPISTYNVPVIEPSYMPAPSVLVDNGVRVGEATTKEDYGAWDGETDEIPVRWAWTHHSTCSCCHSFMEPQPKWWQPLPSPAPRNSPCKPSPDANT